MAAEPKVKNIEGLTVKSTPLPVMRALDLVPELADLLDPTAESDVAMFAAVAKGLRGRLRQLLPQILAGTTVTVTLNGDPKPISLNSPEAIDLAFDGHMRAFIPVVAFALEVSFRDFFEGGAQAVKALRAPSA